MYEAVTFDKDPGNRLWMQPLTTGRGVLLPGRVLGALNVYAHARDAFDGHAVALGVAFAGPATVSVHNAQLLAQAERVVAQLQHALTSRAGIDQAVGVVMSRTGMTAPEAFGQLRGLSQSRSVKLADVASDLLDQAVRRARARHSDTAADTGGAARPG